MRKAALSLLFVALSICNILASATAGNYRNLWDKANKIYTEALGSETRELITNANQLSSNASDWQEGQHIEYLIDNDANTFWHSDCFPISRAVVRPVIQMTTNSGDEPIFHSIVRPPSVEPSQRFNPVSLKPSSEDLIPGVRLQNTQRRFNIFGFYGEARVSVDLSICLIDSLELLQPYVRIVGV